MKTSRNTLVRRGRFIREARTGVDVTQRELSSLLGLQRPGVSAIEAGLRDLSLSEAIIMAKKLGCTVEQLQEGRW